MGATPRDETRIGHTAQRWLVAPLLIAGRIAIVALCSLTVADIVGRQLLGLPVPGIIELAELTLVWSAFAGIAAAFWTGTHVSVELIELFLSRKGLRTLNLAITSILVAVMAWLACLAVAEFLDTLTWGDQTTDLAIPYTWYWGAVVAGYAAAVIVLAARVCVLWQNRSAR